MSCNNQHFQSRLKTGIAGQNEVMVCLNKYHGFNLYEADAQEDRKFKIDCHDDTSFGGPHKYQIKFRESGDDLIVAYRDPFNWTPRGLKFFTPKDLLVEHEKDKIGRDMVGAYDYYICRNRAKTEIRIVLASRLKEIVEDAVKEWTEADTIIERGCPFASRKYNGVQIRHVIDKGQGWGGWPKIIVFVRADNLVNDKEIWHYNYIP